jgi:hypothetical protein
MLTQDPPCPFYTIPFLFEKDLVFYILCCWYLVYPNMIILAIFLLLETILIVFLYYRNFVHAFYSINLQTW